MFWRIVSKTKAMQETYVVFPRLAGKLESGRLYVSLALVLLLHVVLIWLVASQLGLSRTPEGPARVTQVVLIASASAKSPVPEPVPEPRLTAVLNEVSSPDIEILDASPASSGEGAISTDTILPPRPDPAIRNGNPALPAAFAELGSEVQVLLTVLVNANGSIGETRVAKSCGVVLLDQLAQTFAKANWRFRAATANGAAVSDWTTVMVKFAPAG
jgi:TonB family protein